MADELNLGECEVRVLKLEELCPAVYNPRKISDKAFEGLSQSIDKFGMLVPIIWNERSGNIVGGHQRFKHLVELGEEETQVIIVDLDDNEEVALNIALNSTMMRGDFTQEVVGLLAKSQAQMGNAFDSIKLDGLFDQMSKKKWPKDPNEPDDSSSSSSDSGEGDNSPPTPPDDPPDDGPEALIVCPKCKSKWKMSNNEVVHNAVSE
jgi:hypothetical protein